jgi:hypothetical protein
MKHSAAGAVHPVRTCVRIRPLTADEVARGDAAAFEPRGADHRGVLVHRAQAAQQPRGGGFSSLIAKLRRPSANAAADATAGYRFHRVFGPNETNQDVFDDAVAEIVQVGRW